MLALNLILPGTYCVQNYAGIIGLGLDFSLTDVGKCRVNLIMKLNYEADVACYKCSLFWYHYAWCFSYVTI